MNTMQSILEETKKLIQIKQAEFKKRSDAVSTTEVKDNSEDSVGKMTSVDEAAKKPTPKARAEEMDRNVSEKGNTTAGAGDDSEKTRGHATDATQPVEAPTKKPLITDDANAKTASAALANDLMAAIRGYQQTVKSAEVVADEKPTVVPPVAKPAVKKEEKKKEDEKVEEPEAKKANTDEVELTPDVLAKIASLVLSQEEGMALVKKIMEKEAGAEAATQLVNFVNEKQAAADHAAGVADAQAMINQSIYDAGVKDTLAQITVIEKKAAAGQALNAEEQQLIKLGQELANDAMQDMGGAMGGEVPPGMPAGEMPPGMPAEGGAEGAGGDEEISIEELAQALDQLVASGAIQPEDVQKVLEYLSQEGGGEQGAPQGMPGEAPAEAPQEAPAEQAAESDDKEDEKEAAAKQAKITKLANVLAVEIGKASAKK